MYNKLIYIYRVLSRTKWKLSDRKYNIAPRILQTFFYLSLILENSGAGFSIILDQQFESWFDYFAINYTFVILNRTANVPMLRKRACIVLYNLNDAYVKPGTITAFEGGGGQLTFSFPFGYASLFIPDVILYYAFCFLAFQSPTRKSMLCEGRQPSC